MLSPDDEQNLGRQIQQHGDEDALGRLVQSNLRFVVWYANRFRRLGVPLLDLIHEGNLGLIEAARRFDPAGAANFKTTALWWIRQAMLHQLAETGRGGDNPPSGLLAAAASGGLVNAIRVALSHAQAAAEGTEIKEVSNDADDLETHLENRGRRRKRSRAQRKADRDLTAMGINVLRQPSVLRGYLN